jgi:hypothetical protein
MKPMTVANTSPANRVNAVLKRFDVCGVSAEAAEAPGWAILKVADGDRDMPDILASMDAACTALQVDGPYLMSFGWTREPPAYARHLNVPRWPSVQVRPGEETPLDGAIVTDFCTRTALRNKHFWEPGA